MAFFRPKRNYPRRRYGAKTYGKPYSKPSYGRKRQLTASSGQMVIAHSLLPKTGSIDDCFTVASVTSSQIFQQFAVRYGQFRVKWMSIKMISDDGSVSPIAYTVCSKDDVLALGSENAALRNVSCVMHDMRSTEKTQSRSLKLFGPQWSEFNRCSDAATALSASERQAGIKLFLPGSSNSVQVYVSWGLEFRGLSDEILTGN